MAPTSRPPLLPPMMPRCAGVVTLRRDQVLGHGDEVVVGALRLALSAAWCQRRAELAAAADVGQHVARRPRSSQAAPEPPAVAGRSEISKPP